MYRYRTGPITSIELLLQYCCIVFYVFRRAQKNREKNSVITEQRPGPTRRVLLCFSFFYIFFCRHDKKKRVKKRQGCRHHTKKKKKKMFSYPRLTKNNTHCSLASAIEDTMALAILIHVVLSSPALPAPIASISAIFSIGHARTCLLCGSNHNKDSGNSEREGKKSRGWEERSHGRVHTL